MISLHKVICLISVEHLSPGIAPNLATRDACRTGCTLSKCGLRWLRLLVEVLQLVGMLLQFERLRAGLCQGFRAEPHIFDQFQALLLLFCGPPPADSNI